MSALVGTIAAQLTVQTFIIFITVGFVSWFVFRIVFPNRGTLPPGPLPLPIIGNLLQIATSGKDQYAALLDMSKKYGNMFTIQVANFQIVVLTGYKLIREGMIDKGHTLRGRPNDLYMPRRLFGKRVNACQLVTHPRLDSGESLCYRFAEELSPQSTHNDRIVFPNRGTLPPGPLPLPIIGNLLQIATSGKDQYAALLDMSKKYGNMFTIQVANFQIVVLTGYKLIREGMIDKGHTLRGRPNDLYMPRRLFGKRGVLWGSGERWHGLRKFTAIVLRDLGVGRKTLEERIQDEATVIMRELEDTTTPFQSKKMFIKAAANIVCSIVRGERYEYGDPEFQHLMHVIDFIFKNSTIMLPENFFEWLAYLPINTKAKQVLACNEELKVYMHRLITEHERDFDPDNPRDYLDMFLKVRQESPENIALEEENIFRSIVDLFMAGTETTGTSLSWLFVHMLNKPVIQDKCREEIHRVVGTERMVCLADKESLPYLCATISEMQRLCSIAPVALPHQVEEPVEIGGYYLPKGTAVIFNLYSAHTDPEYWSRPLEFDPDRWLSPDGKLIKHDAFWPFSAGARMCLGKQLAQRELFLFFSNLLQRYKFTKPDEDPMPSTIGRQTGITLQPIEYRLCAKRVV